MNKEQLCKIEIEKGVLPSLLAKGKVFKLLSMMQQNEHQHDVKKYKQLLYRTMNEILGVQKPKSPISYRNWFANPEKYVNKAFLENERKDENKWMIVVSAMYQALSETLMKVVHETSVNLKLYKERNEIFSDALNTYLKSNEKAA